LADAAKGKLEVVIVQRFDRAARSVKQLVETLNQPVA
jgi:DNA invertase Pin-like site-specific DNA recombinase